MNPTIDITPFLAIPVHERISLIQALLDSIAEETVAPEDSPEFQRELERRLEYARASPDSCLPWDQVKANILSRSRE